MNIFWSPPPTPEIPKWGPGPLLSSDANRCCRALRRDWVGNKEEKGESVRDRERDRDGDRNRRHNNNNNNNNNNHRDRNKGKEKKGERRW